ncbi:MAG: lipase family protein, partial [Corynebacterium sp.]|uniref:lipase family protein n=1 Tax=Corynebacterium sp. TaxID=1720 RepID=UPI002647BD4D
DPSIAEPASDPFYTPPATIPDAPGSLIRDQRASHPLDVAARADKILYTSTTQDGVPVATSATVIEPAGRWQGNGPTPTIVFAPGTRGSGDDCAPSRADNLLGAITDDSSQPMNFNYEYPFYAAASAMGIRVIAADLIDLGTPGQHTYVNHTEEGQAVLDAARAGVEFVGAAADSPIGFYGYSQGGGAAAGAADHAATYAPELNVKGTFAGAPPADLLEVVKAVDNHMIAGVAGYALNGALARHPELADLQDEYFNEKGHEFMAATADECIGNSVENWENTDTRTLTKDGRSFSGIAESDPRLRDVLTNSHYRLGTRALNAPMLVLNAAHDDTIPYDQSREMAASYCALGGSDGAHAPVQFITDPMPEIAPKTAANHAVPMFSQAGTAFSWIVDRFNGVAAPNSCGSL